MPLRSPEQLDQWVPHRGRMSLLSRIIEANEHQVVAEVDVEPDSPFAADRAMPAWVGVEYMAQTIAAWSGERARQRGGSPRIGLLLGTRQYKVTRPGFPFGSTLRVQARCELMGDNGLGSFRCTIALDGTEVASALLSVFEPADDSALIQSGRAP